MKRCILLFLVLLVLTPIISAQECGHHYPRISNFQWPGGAVEWWSRFDIVIGRPSGRPLINSENLEKIKQLNPAIKIIGTEDWNAAAHMNEKIPEPHRLMTSKGETYGWYVGLNPAVGQMAGNFADVCPLYDGKKFNEFFVDFLFDEMNMDLYDGIATDGLYAGEHMKWRTPKNIDINRNGVSDWDEHPTEDFFDEYHTHIPWVTEHWNNGVITLMQNVRDRIGPDKYMIINTGAGFRGLADITVPNGLIWEYSGPDHDFDWKRRNMDHNIKRTAQPHISLFLYQASWGHPDNPNPEWEFFPYIRYGLTQTMMWGFYFQYEPLLLIDGGGRYEHLHNKYYDEYDLDVGCPTSEMQRIGQSEIWARFFDQGAAILNANGHDVTVTDEQLKELDGYDGPYYRFRGGQDSDFNNGELFNFVDLKGYSFKENKLDYKSGDGIVLVKIPQTVVSEIIIDDHNSGTSPASRKAEFSGNWQHSCEGGSHYAVAHCAMNLKDKLYLTAYTTEDSGNAVFRPTISIAGDYEVFEWHGNIKDKQEASNVEYELKHANGVETGLIDQSAIQGKWNSLGIFSFEKGTTGFVKLKASGANGAVVADAVKFVYVDDEGSGFVAADLNEDGVVDILDLVLLVRAFGTSEYDLTSDGTVDVQDLLIIIQKL